MDLHKEKKVNEGVLRGLRKIYGEMSQTAYKMAKLKFFTTKLNIWESSPVNCSRFVNLST